MTGGAAPVRADPGQKQDPVHRSGIPRHAFQFPAPDRSGDLSTDVVTTLLKRTDHLPSDPSGEARELFNLGLVHALEYGVASADLKPSIPWARSRFLERKRLR